MSIISLDKKYNIETIVLNVIFTILVLIGPGFVRADITYTFHLDGVDAGIRTQIENGVREAVAIYNQYGSFNKHLNITYTDWPGVTAEANFNGDIKFGALRGTRVTLHEMAHTMGCGTYWDWGNHMIGGVWNGASASVMIKQFDGGGASLYGDNWHFWPYGLNYDNEDGYVQRYRHVRIVAALVADMGFPSFMQEPSSQFLSTGQTAVFSVQAANANSYAWYRQGYPDPLTNNDRISGASTRALTINNVQPGDTGRYYCIISGELSSRSAGLMVEKHVGHWPLSGDSLDMVGNNHATTRGDIVYSSGKIGQAIDFDGINDSVILPSGVADTVDITITAWVNWRGGGNWQRIFDFGNNTDQYLALIPKSGDNTLRFSIKNGGGEQIVDTAVLPVNQWVHVAVRLSGNTGTIFVNGTAVAGNSGMAINPIDFAPNYNYVGDSQYVADPLFNGLIDEFHVYSYALSNAEIQDTALCRPVSPLPVDGASDMPTQMALGWGSDYAAGNAWQVYLGTTQAGVSAAEPGTGQYYGVRYQEQFSTPILEPNTDYYWRVDLLGSDGIGHKGNVWSFTTGVASEQVTPKFKDYYLTKSDAVEGNVYSSSLLDDIVLVKPSTFEKVAGPEWIEVLSDGQITGTPPEGAAGENSCVVRVKDSDNYTDEAVVSLVVGDTCSGSKGMPDLMRFAEQWGNEESAFCSADLDQDNIVDLADWRMFSTDWNRIVEPGLVVAWAMDNACGDIVNDVLGQYPGVIQNMDMDCRPKETIAAQSGFSLVFDGVDDYVVVPGYKGVLGGSSRSCCVWVQMAGSQPGMILSWGDDQIGKKWILGVADNGTVGVSISGEYIVTLQAINDGLWHHIAVILDEGQAPEIGKISIYIDGILQSANSTITQAVDTTAGQDLMIGAVEVAGEVSSYFSGKIDKVQIYDRSLTSKEIVELADMATLAYWRFEEGPLDASVTHGGANQGVYYPGVFDHSGHGNHLSVFYEGWAGYAYRNDIAGFPVQTGEDNNFSVQNTGEFPALFTGSQAMRTITPVAWTIEVSFKPENGGYRTLVGRDSYGAVAASPELAALYMQINPADGVAIAFADMAGNWHKAQSEDGLIDGYNSPNTSQGHWYHMAAVSDGSLLSLYLADATEGTGYQLVAQADLSLSTNSALSAGVGFGGDWQAGTWSVGRGLYGGKHTDRAYGFIDEVRISSQALAPTQFLYAQP